MKEPEKLSIYLFPPEKLKYFRKLGSADALTTADKKFFRRKVYRYFSENGRSLPWRYAKNSYHIFVSEMMLQQTQVDRVIPKYQEFLKQFPGFEQLANAPFNEVLAVWKGLGYNRRALALHNAAKIVVSKHNSLLPDNYDELVSLPGIGHATACEIRAFAFGKASAFIETNIRTVYLHTFFDTDEKIADSQIMPFVEKTLDNKNPREWYYALMDYGVLLKKLYPNPSRKSAHHAKQSKFEGSFRQLRGKILEILLEKGTVSAGELAELTERDHAETEKAVGQLTGEGMIEKTRNRYRIK